MCGGCSSQRRRCGKEPEMLCYAAIFLVVGLILGGLNVAGIAPLVTQGAWTLFLSGTVLVMIHELAERTNRLSSLIRFATRVHP